MRHIPFSRLLLFFPVALGSLWSADIRLSPGGPVSTLEAARDAARRAAKPARILVGKGVYPITEPLLLGPEDSQVTWEGSSDGQAVISDGRRIGGWKPAGGGLWRAEIPEVREGKWYFEQLWVNGRRAVRARTPNKGFLHMDAPGEWFLGRDGNLLYYPLPGENMSEVEVVAPAAEMLSKASKGPKKSCPPVPPRKISARPALTRGFGRRTRG